MRRTNDLSYTMQECVNWLKTHGVKYKVIQNDNYDCVAIYNREKRKYSIVPSGNDMVMLINHEQDFDDVKVTVSEFEETMEKCIEYGEVVGVL